MKDVKYAIYALPICLSFIIGACVAASGGRPTPPPLAAMFVANGHQCLKAPATWHATWIASPDQLKRFVSKCRANRLGFASGNIPVIDFDRWQVLAVEMGQRPAAGYGFDADGITAQMKDQIVTVRLSVHRPSPDALVAQMITTPWILIGLQKGPYQTVHVLDQQARLLIQIDNPG